MNTPLVSICMLTIDRYQMTKRCLENLILKAGIPSDQIELLILDNGSTDSQTMWYSHKMADQCILQPKNIGVAAGFNKLFRLATGTYICVVGNDIWLEKDWLKTLIDYNQCIKNSGISAIHCVLDKGKYDTKRDIYIPPHNLVYGVSLWKRSLFDIIGGFDERLTGYGCEDSQFCYRAFKTGHTNFYVPGQNSYHLGEDQNSDSEYRKNKNKDFEKNTRVLQETLKKMELTKKYKLPL